VLNTKKSLFRVFLTIPWVPVPQFEDLVNYINE
jgi:hypothetical protein